MPSSLISAKIRGIRSYSPLESKTQTIEFMPLTLIIGANGTGKTTIIEALKFIIAGVDPPLSDFRRNFVNTNHTEAVKGSAYASIELEFINSKNQHCIARREISKGNTKTSPLSVSSCYKVKGSSWLPVHKLEDWGKAIPALFNLPNRAILENVVLCHQEDSLWCMGASATVKQVFDEVFGCEQYKKEIKHVDAEIKSSRSELDVSERDMARLKERVERKNSLAASLNDLRSDIEKMTLRCSMLEAKISEITDKKERVVKDIQAIEMRGIEVKNLRQKLTDLERQKRSLQSSLRQPVIERKSMSNEELQQKIQDHKEFVQQTKTKQNESLNKASSLKNEVSRLERKRSSIQVKELAQVKGNLSKMNTITRRMDETDDVKSLRHLITDTDSSVENLIKQMKIDVTDLSEANCKLEELDNLSDMIELKKAEINDIYKLQMQYSDNLSKSFETDEEYKKNVQIRALVDQISEIEFDIEASESADDGSLEKLEQLKRDLKEIQRLEYEARDERSSCIGTKQQIERQVKSIDTELGLLHKVNREYAECLGKVACNRIVHNDLTKLKQCLQQSIITFHDQMILRINDALRVRWKQIYQGSDIDTIELVDEELMKGKTKMVNYYIAMVKHGERMKMREKSSAGQKVLASIILRITLAELFLKDFAFIALDEPTANLDLANVKSLAKAIGLYVRRRKTSGTNIQWIIITHDEQFLKALDAECSPYFYRTKLGDDGCSNIVKLSSVDLEFDYENADQ